MYIYIYIYMYIYIYIYIYIYNKNIYLVVKAMCSPGYHYNGFAGTHAFEYIP